MKHLSTILITLVAMLVLTVGCANILDDEFYSITPHEALPYEREPVERISVSDIDEFKEILIDLIMEHETEAQVLFHHFGTEDIQAALELAATQIRNNHPIGAYAVSQIDVTATGVVTYFEIDVTIEFARTVEEIDAIITVESEPDIMDELLYVMSQHSEQVVFRSTLQFTEEAITGKISEIYYQNPRSIVMLPIVTVETFPEEGEDRIYSIQFSYADDFLMMQQFSFILSVTVNQFAERVPGDTDKIRLLNLVRDLAASIDFDEASARVISVPGAQHISATAFGALFRNRAVGEGFAMAFKAVSDELGFDNRIVLGYLEGQIHAWNIVELYGHYYHIDIAMISEYGLERAFFKTDSEFEAMGYEWDRENTVIANGPLTLEDFLALEEPDYDEYDYDNAENGSRTEAGDVTGNEPGDEPSNNEPDEPDDEPSDDTNGEDDNEPEEGQSAEEE